MSIFKQSAGPTIPGAQLHGLLILFCLVGLWGISQDAAAEVFFVEGDPNAEFLLLNPRLEIRGNIWEGDRAQLIKLLPIAITRSRLKDRPVVRLNSRGGDVVAAMWMGHLLRKVNAVTIVGPREECSSACVLLLSAGTLRLARHARVGLHRAHFDSQYFARLSRDQAQSRYRILEDGVRAYLKEMGMPDALYEQMRRVPSDQMRFLTNEEIDALMLNGSDPASQEYDEAKLRQDMGEGRYNRLKDAESCMNAGESMKFCMGKYFPNE